MKRLISFVFFIISTLSQAKPIELTLWHSLAGQSGEELKKLSLLFNKSQSEYSVNPIYKGEYSDTLTSFVANFRAKKPPSIVQIFEVGTALMLNPEGTIKPLEILMKEQGIEFPLNSILPSVRGYYSKNDQLQALPFNISLPVMYYNKNTLKKLGYADERFPKTWDELEGLLSLLQKNGFHCGYTSAYPAWIQIEAYSALHNLTPLSKSILLHLTRLKKWQDLHYFQYGGRKNEATILFTSGHCVLFSQSSGAYGSLSQLVPFDLGVAALPSDPLASSNRFNNIVGGGALWAVSGQSQEKYKGIAKFFAFLTDPLIQERWYLKTGYLPIGLRGIYREILIKSQDPILLLANQDWNRRTASTLIMSNQSPQNQIRTANDEAIENIFANIKTPEQALADASHRINYLLMRFFRNNTTT
jgi:sn-glycerol 3-phosphate transport system substrate-binding protein